MEIVINGRFLTQSVTGVQRYARELVQALDAILDVKPEFRVTIISPRLKDTPPVWRNIELSQVGYLQGQPWEQFELPWYSRGKTLFCPENTAPLLSVLGHQRLVVTVHDLSYLYFPKAYTRAFRAWYRMIIPLILRRADNVITVSESERQAILSRYPHAAARLCAIQNGGLSSHLNTQLAEQEEDVRDLILYVGSLSSRKNFQGAMAAACRLAHKRGFKFVFVGGTATNIRESNIEVPPEMKEQIALTGQVDDTAILISHYRRAACFLFPSFYEASPLPPIEAMACGCPVVASDIPALRERCGDAALYCDPYDIESICAAVLRIMDDSGLRSKLRALGYQRAAAFTWEACAKSTLDILTKVAGEPNR